MSAISDPLISISAAARGANVHPSTLSKQIREGAVRSHDGKVRLSEVLADRAANIDLGRSKRRQGAIDEPERNSAPATPPKSLVGRAPTAEVIEPDPEDESEGDRPPVIVDGVAMDYADARALKETFLARLKRLEYETKRGELGRIADFKARGTDIIVLVKNALLAVPGECADMLSPDQVEYVRDKLYEAMEHLYAFGAEAEALLAAARAGDTLDPDGD